MKLGSITSIMTRLQAASVPAGVKRFLFSKVSRPTMKPIQPPILWASGALYTDIKQLGCEADDTFPSSFEVKNEYSHMSTPPAAFMECTGDNFTLQVQCFCLAFHSCISIEYSLLFYHCTNPPLRDSYTNLIKC